MIFKSGNSSTADCIVRKCIPDTDNSGRKKISSNIRLETGQYNFHRMASSYATGWKEAE